jgi:hypothetical protein
MKSASFIIPLILVCTAGYFYFDDPVLKIYSALVCFTAYIGFAVGLRIGSSTVKGQEQEREQNQKLEITEKVISEIARLALFPAAQELGSQIKESMKLTIPEFEEASNKIFIQRMEQFKEIVLAISMSEKQAEKILIELSEESTKSSKN